MKHRKSSEATQARPVSRRAQRQWCGNLEILDKRELLATFTVTNTGSDPATAGTLAWAITQANIDATPDTINFSISGVTPYQIDLNEALPAITQPVTIDGTTQPGYDPSKPLPVIQVTGKFIGNVDPIPPFYFTPTPNISGFVVRTGNTDINAPATTIKGLAIGHFTGNGIDVVNSSNVFIQGVHVGVGT
ncbi:MAG: hypothetical protein ACKO85_05330, partial [Isosphaeraceae bacterium]